MRSLAGELAPFGISVNAVAPPLTATAPALAFVDSLADMGLTAEQVEAMRSSMPQPEDVVLITVFLATPEGRRLSGQLLTMGKDELVVIGPPKGGRPVRAAGERWTGLEELRAAVGELLGRAR
jgi:NAD(P)-dependent dehydrogenase (short-subunit alcohol dehydrogenase family)